MAAMDASWVEIKERRIVGVVVAVSVLEVPVDC